MIKRLLLTAALVCGPVQAEFYSGNDLLQKMDGEFSDRSLALGFVAGVADVWTNISVCPPKNVTLGQAHDIVRRYLVDNPQTRHFTAESLAKNALERVWPCRRGSGT
jgi:hypothetical protein